MDRVCEVCKGPVTGRRTTCSERCKKRRQRSATAERPAAATRQAAHVTGRVGSEPALVAEVRRELEAAGRVETADGQQALFLAALLTSPSADTKSAVATLSKELRAARQEALKGATHARSGLDEVRARRDAKRGA